MRKQVRATHSVISALLLGALQLIVMLPAFAAREFKAGEAVTLAEGNGLLVVLLNSLEPLEFVSLDRRNATFGGEKLMTFSAGRSLRLVELPAGEYQWAKATFKTPSAFASTYITMRKDPALAFKIEPGVINYSGDLDLDGTVFSGWFRTERNNRLAAALLQLEREFPNLRKQYPLRWQGSSPDRYIDLLDKQLAGATVTQTLEKAASATLIEPENRSDAPFKVLVAELFAPGQVDRILMNPSGSMLAVSELHNGKSSVRLIDTDSFKETLIFDSVQPVSQLQWASDDTMLLGAGYGFPLGLVYHITRKPADAPVFERVQFPGSGQFIGTVGSSGKVALYSYTDKRGETAAFRVDISGKRIDINQFNRSLRVDKGIDGWVQMLVDANGEPRAALVREGGELVLKQRRPGQREWLEVRRLTSDSAFVPLSLDSEGASLYALSNIDRDQTELVRVALDNGAIVETVFAVPGIDLIGAKFDNSKRPVSATYSRDGQVAVHYFDMADRSLQRTLQGGLPGRTIVHYQISMDGRRSLVYAFSETDPGTYYLYDAKERRLEELLPTIDPLVTAKAKRSDVVAVKANDGLAVESYLTLPTTAGGPFPLVVMPHGGPIGARDTLVFDPEVQLLANRGYAVLRVNYRGSAGFGRHFLESGMGNWGKQIEDDVLAALDTVLSRYPIDRHRVALRGTSYGGYSTLMGLIRTPERFRCGIAIAAVTDLPLLFVSIDWSTNSQLKKSMQQIVGNPDTALPQLEAASPDYLHERLRKPLLLIHGSNDRRVPIEHALRLRLLMAASGHAPQWLPVSGAGHADFDMDARLRVESAVDQFLANCMRTPSAPAAAK